MNDSGCRSRGALHVWRARFISYLGTNQGLSGDPALLGAKMPSVLLGAKVPSDLLAAKIPILFILGAYLLDVGRSLPRTHKLGLDASSLGF